MARIDPGLSAGLALRRWVSTWATWPDDTGEALPDPRTHRRGHIMIVDGWSSQAEVDLS